MAKETKTREELEALIMTELGKHPDCGGVEVVINPPAANLPWSTSVSGSGPQINHKCRKVIQAVADQLYSKFDMA